MKNKKSRGIMKTFSRMFVTCAGSYFGAKAAGWIFDRVIVKRSK